MADVRCPYCAASVERSTCSACSWRLQRTDSAYLRTHFPRFPLAAFGTAGAWVGAGLLGGWAIVGAVLWSGFFVGLVVLTFKHARSLALVVPDPRLLRSASPLLDSRAEAFYGCGYDDLREQYLERCQLTQTCEKNRIPRDEALELALVAEERMRRVMES